LGLVLVLLGTEVCADAEVVIDDQEGRTFSPVQVCFELLVEFLGEDDFGVGRLFGFERLLLCYDESVFGLIVGHVVLV